MSDDPKFELSAISTTWFDIGTNKKLDRRRVTDVCLNSPIFASALLTSTLAKVDVKTTGARYL